MRFIIIPFIILLALSGCSSDETAVSFQYQCPKVRILAEAADITRYVEGQVRDITSIDYKASIGFLSGQCLIEKKRLRISLPIAIDFERGPANKTGVINMSSFIAIVNQDKEIVAKREIPISIEFLVNQFATQYSELINIDIPFIVEAKKQRHEIFLGIVISREEASEKAEKS